MFDLSIVPNSADLDPTFGQFQWVGEIERRYELWGHPGKIAITGFLTRGRMGSFDDAIALAAVTGGPADIAAVRQYQSRGGVSMNLEQEITSESRRLHARRLGRRQHRALRIHRRRSHRRGRRVAIRQAMGPARRHRRIAGVVNGISSVHEAFLNDGGLGILVGDGQLPHPGPRADHRDVLQLRAYILDANVSFDYQLIVNPAYNTDRGPVNVFAGRIHSAF